VDASGDVHAPLGQRTAGGTPTVASERPRRAAEYAGRKQQFRARAEGLTPRAQRALHLSGLAFALAILAMLSVVLDGVSPWVLLGGVAGLAAFSVLMVRHARLRREEDEAWRWWKVNERGERRCQDAWRELPEDGAEFIDAAHPFTRDLDVFGESSLFQFINVAHTRHGQRALAGFLSERGPLVDSIARQAAVRRLAPELEWRQRLETLTLLAAPGPEAPRSLLPRLAARPASARPDTEALLDWAESPPRFLSRRGLLWAARVLPVLSAFAVVASLIFGLSPLLWKGTVLLQALVVVRTRREVGALYGLVSRWQSVLGRLGLAFRLVEDLRFDDPLLEQLRRSLQSDGRRASVELERLDGVLGWFALRNSEWGHPPINLLCSWDIHCVVALERWQRKSGQRLGTWLEAIGRVEALSSLAGAAHDNPEFTFPELGDGPAELSAIGLGHPLLAPGVRVENDVALSGPGRALLVTGSNMSGKSTLLRAMGLGSVMAFAGAPVCARSMRIGSLAVFTSLRVTDSLADGVSRFYAELERLRAMLTASRGPLPVLFLVDEILAGTNSIERGVGARWVLGELLRAGALGAVSTHDAALCQLPAALMDRVQQVHFRESVENGELGFDYRLRAGPVKAGNALSLMRSLGFAIP
jgi:hypothetical protein